MDRANLQAAEQTFSNTAVIKNSRVTRAYGGQLEYS